MSFVLEVLVTVVDVLKPVLLAPLSSLVAAVETDAKPVKESSGEVIWFPRVDFVQQCFVHWWRVGFAPVRDVVEFLTLVKHGCQHGTQVGGAGVLAGVSIGFEALGFCAELD